MGISAARRQRRLSMTITISFSAIVPSEGRSLGELSSSIAQILKSSLGGAILTGCPKCGPISVTGVLCNGAPCVPTSSVGAVGLSNGAIAGIVLGTIVFVALIVGGLVFSGS